MKYILLLVIVLAGSFTCAAQVMATDLKVTYQLYSKGQRSVTYPVILHIRDKVTVYEMKTSLSQAWNGKITSKLPVHTVSDRVKDDYLKIDHTTKELLGFAPLPGSLGNLIKDNYPEINWAVTDDSKTISGYKCFKAVGTYRGREWAVWFAPEIAVPYGPWKLHGLPGLILEAISTDEYTIKLTTIEKTKSSILDKDFKTLKITRNKIPVTYQQHLKDEHEGFSNQVAKMRSEGMNINLEVAPPNGEELKYEWEE